MPHRRVDRFAIRQKRPCIDPNTLAGFKAKLDTYVAIARAGPGALVIVATRSGRLQLIRLRV